MVNTNCNESKHVTQIIVEYKQYKLTDVIFPISLTASIHHYIFNAQIQKQVNKLARDATWKRPTCNQHAANH